MNGCRRIIVLAISVVLILSTTETPLNAASPSCLQATKVNEGDALELTAEVEATDEVRLAGIIAPLPPADVPSSPPWPLAAMARDALSALVKDHCLRLAPERPTVDRYNRLVAHVFRDDGLWVQAELVMRGLARVLPGLDDPARIRQLLPLEADARAAHRGLWADDHYAVRSAETVERDVGTLQIVEGKVVKAARIGPRVYLNFGEDWRHDFTIVIPAKSLGAWMDAGLDPLQLADKRVRVRGVITSLNGPMIEATQPEVIEILD